MTELRPLFINKTTFFSSGVNTLSILQYRHWEGLASFMIFLWRFITFFILFSISVKLSEIVKVASLPRCPTSDLSLSTVTTATLLFVRWQVQWLNPSNLVRKYNVTSSQGSSKSSISLFLIESSPYIPQQLHKCLSWHNYLNLG